MCVEVSGKKVEGVVLAGLYSGEQPEFAGASAGFRVFLALATILPGNESLLANAGRIADHVEEAGRLPTNLTSLAITMCHHSLSSCGLTFSSSTNASISQSSAYQ